MQSDKTTTDLLCSAPLLWHRLKLVEELPLRQSATEWPTNCDVGHFAGGDASER
jgi:hypothetical protein